MEKYYEILGVPQTATLEELKKAYRLRAKELHPDVNKRPDAHERFLELTEAYEYLQNKKTGRVYDSRKRKYTKTGARRYKSYEEWAKEQSQRTRKRANFYAQKSYKEFEKSEYYQAISALSAIMDFVELLYVVAAVIVMPIGVTIALGLEGFFGSLILLFILSPQLIHSIRNVASLDFSTVWEGFVVLLKTESFWIITLVALNVVVLFRVVLNTFIEVRNIELFYLIPIALSLIYIKRKKISSTYTRIRLIVGSAPAISSIFFLVNFIFSSGPVQETYKFRNYMQWTKRGLQATTYIFLEGGKYDDYFGVRLFWDYDRMAGRSVITYTLAEGCLGLKVVKDYKFDLAQ